MAKIIVSLKNWKKMNPRKDVQKSTWFRMEHSMVTDSDFYDFTDGEFKAWIYIMSMASQKSSDTVRLETTHADRAARVSEQNLRSAIKKLEELEILTVDDTDTSRGRHADVTDACSTNVRTYDTNERTNPAEAGSSLESSEPNPSANFENSLKFDFQALFALYPRHEQKTKALQTLAASIKTQDDYDLVKTAITRYAAHCNSSTAYIEYQYRKKFLNWWEEGWRDWLDPKTGTGSEKPSSSSKRVDPPEVWQKQKAEIDKAKIENRGKTLDMEGCASVEELLAKKARELGGGAA